MTEIPPPPPYSPDLGDGYEATIERVGRWGPFAWHISISSGLIEWGLGQSAWTEKGARRKARRTMAQMEAADQRRKASRQVLSL